MYVKCKEGGAGVFARRTVKLKMTAGFANASHLWLVSTPFTNVMLFPTAYVPGEQAPHVPLEDALPGPQGGDACSK